MMRHAIYAPLLLVPALGGCINLGLGNAKTPAALYTLTPESAPVDGSTTSGKAHGELSVLAPETGAELGVMRVAVKSTGLPLTRTWCRARSTLMAPSLIWSFCSPGAVIPRRSTDFTRNTSSRGLNGLVM